MKSEFTTIFHKVNHLGWWVTHNESEGTFAFHKKGGRYEVHLTDKSPSKLINELEMLCKKDNIPSEVLKLGRLLGYEQVVFVQHDEGVIKFIHHMPFDEDFGLGKSYSELSKSGILAVLPDLPKDKDSNFLVLCIDTETNELYYKEVNEEWTMIE